jgi:peptidoglycan/xylan/chitin deacetylase (PgdA/CDA1 family)
VAGKFILSLDCEGKWGVADHLRPQDHEGLSDARLREAYDGILAALDRYDIPATFAFVGLFTLPLAELKRLEPDLARLRQAAPHYLGPALDDALRGTGQGWTGDWALERTASATTTHELGLHGVTHLPWASVDEAFVREEMALFANSGAALAGRSTTFVYPRNAVAHQSVLGAFGIGGYRKARPGRSRLASLLSEVDFTTPPDPDAPAPGAGEPVEIPPGYFVNWLSGARALIPIEVSRARARAILKRAAKSGGVVHYWTHPENIATAPATLTLLSGILEDVARMRDAGQIEVLTQQAYVARITG